MNIDISMPHGNVCEFRSQKSIFTFCSTFSAWILMTRLQISIIGRFHVKLYSQACIACIAEINFNMSQEINIRLNLCWDFFVGLWCWFYPCPSELLYWHRCRHCAVPVKLPWRIWVRTSYKSIIFGDITITKQKTAKTMCFHDTIFSTAAVYFETYQISLTTQ